MSRTTRICLAPALFLSVLIAGCGTLRVNSQTVIERRGRCSREVRMTAGGMFATMLANSRATQSSWTIERGWSGTEYHIVWRQDFPSVPAANVPLDGLSGEGAGSVSSQSPRLALERANYWFVTYYRYSETYPQSEGSDAGADPFAPKMNALADAMFSMEAEVVVPGKIIDSNADRTEKNLASWSLSSSRLDQGVKLWVVARRFNALPIVLGTLLVLGAAALITRSVLRKGAAMTYEPRGPLGPPGDE